MPSETMIVLFLVIAVVLAGRGFSIALSVKRNAERRREQEQQRIDDAVNDIVGRYERRQTEQRRQSSRDE